MIGGTPKGCPARRARRRLNSRRCLVCRVFWLKRGLKEGLALKKMPFLVIKINLL